MAFNKIYIDTTKSRTDLCNLGAQHGTDKSPFNTGFYRHSYTAVYDLLFSPHRYKNINVGEIGILDNASMKCWRTYFPNAHLYGYDFDYNKLNSARLDNLYYTRYDFMDCSNAQSIDDSLSNSKVMFDILIDDASHEVAHQINVVKSAVKYLKPGGMLIIEDIFSSSIEDVNNEFAPQYGVTGVNQYETALESYSKYFNHISWLVSDHELKFVPQWDNNAWLVLVRNNVE
jgi:hypothetical protein